MQSSTASIGILVVLVGGIAQAQEGTPPCSLAADSWSLEGQSTRGVFRGIRVTCEDVNIAADEATAAEVLPEQGEWQFRGNLRIEIESAVLTADSATFAFTDNDVVSAELVGTPAVLEDFIAEENDSVRGTAGRIQYDNVARTATMEDGASLVLGTSEMSGCGIVYHLDTGAADSVANCGEPFVIKYLPRRGEDAASDEAQPAQ
ncbi:MAG TPA: LptA/OstA family protein [Gammaproteobacteria bacterium]